MKRIILVGALLVQAVALHAIPVDFSALGAATVDISSSVNPDGTTLDGVTFRYVDFGDLNNFATISSLGVTGSNGGSLILDFSAPATALSFSFTVFPFAPPVAEAIYATLRFGTGDTGVDVIVPASLSDGYDGALGSFSYSGSTFNHVEMYFAYDEPLPYFSVDTLSYEPAPVGLVPDASSTIGLMAMGFVGLVGVRRFVVPKPQGL